MVGVPGGSNGCNTCRQRKVKCGLQKPQCAQCLKYGSVCSGYQRELIFVHNGTLPNKNGKAIIKTNKRTRNPGLGRANICMSSLLDRKRLAQIKTSIRPMDPGMVISPSALYRQQLLDIFLSSYVPLAKIGPATEEPWLCMLPGLTEPTRALEVATMALCTARLGRTNGDLSMVTQSHKLYTQGLCEIQNSLWNPHLMYRDETLGASMILAMYELLECPANTNHGYVSHHNGCARLVQLRGPKAHSSGLGYQLFTTFRTQGILRTLELCQPTYLTDVTWMKEPWEQMPKSPLDKVLDVLAFAPVILTQVAAMMEREDGDRLPRALGIIKSCWELDTALLDFYEKLRLSFPGPLYWSEFSKKNFSIGNNPDSTKMFPVAFHFPDLRVAKTLMFYWATQTVLWSGMSQLYRLIPTLPPTLTQCDVPKLPPLANRGDFISQVRNVCQSVEYCIQDDMLALGPNLAIAPLMIITVTLKSYPEYTDELRWAVAALDKLQDTGVRILEYQSAIKP